MNIKTLEAEIEKLKVEIAAKDLLIKKLNNDTVTVYLGWYEEVERNGETREHNVTYINDVYVSEDEAYSAVCNRRYKYDDDGNELDYGVEKHTISIKDTLCIRVRCKAYNKVKLTKFDHDTKDGVYKCKNCGGEIVIKYGVATHAEVKEMLDKDDDGDEDDDGYAWRHDDD